MLPLLYFLSTRTRVEMSSMSIFKRIRDIVDARINDLLDEFDDPIATGNQMIREIENLIVEMRRNVTAAIAMPYLTEIRLTKKAPPGASGRAAPWVLPALSP